jgi:hypothetical protein
VIIIIFNMSTSIFNRDKSVVNKASDKDFFDKDKVIEMADGVKGDIRWQEFFEDAIETEQDIRTKEITIIKENIKERNERQEIALKHEFSELKSRFSSVLSELEKLKLANRELKDEVKYLAEDDNIIRKPADLSIININEEAEIINNFSEYNYIPATSYVTGHLLGGINASTSVTASSSPIPVVIRLTNKGSLPKDFAVDIKECQILGSAYGDISSERAIIRAEEMICRNKNTGIITSTNISGVVHGDDGINGIKGVVVSMSQKHIKNAFLGGVIGGAGKALKGASGFDITALGSVSKKKQNSRDMFKSAGAEGLSGAFEKLADYHIKLAENISPVITIPAGTKVDILFTKSVKIGSSNIRGRSNNFMTLISQSYLGKYHTRLALICMLFFITNCSSVYNSKFTCRDAKGMHCVMINKVDKLITSGEIEEIYQDECNKKCSNNKCNKSKCKKALLALSKNVGLVKKDNNIAILQDTDGNVDMVTF